MTYAEWLKMTGWDDNEASRRSYAADRRLRACMAFGLTESEAEDHLERYDLQQDNARTTRGPYDPLLAE